MALADVTPLAVPRIRGEPRGYCRLSAGRVLNDPGSWDTHADDMHTVISVSAAPVRENLATATGSA